MGTGPVREGYYPDVAVCSDLPLLPSLPLPTLEDLGRARNSGSTIRAWIIAGCWLSLPAGLDGIKLANDDTRAAHGSGPTRLARGALIPRSCVTLTTPPTPPMSDPQPHSNRKFACH